MLAALATHSWASPWTAGRPAVMTDATEEAPRRKSVPRPQQRVAFMVSNGISFQDVLAASCRTVTMSRAIAEAQGLVEATQPAGGAAAAAEEMLTFVQKYKRPADAKVCDWFVYEMSPTNRDGLLEPVKKLPNSLEIQDSRIRGMAEPIVTTLFALPKPVKHAYLNGGLEYLVRNGKTPDSVPTKQRAFDIRRLEFSIVIHQAAQNYMQDVDADSVNPAYLSHANELVSELAKNDGELPAWLEFDEPKVRAAPLLTVVHASMALSLTVAPPFARSPRCAATSPSSKESTSTSRASLSMSMRGRWSSC